MTMKPTATQAVRLLSSTAAVPAGRARAPRGPLRSQLHSQFQARLAPETGLQVQARPDDDDTPAQPDVLPAAAAAPALPEPALSGRIARACARDERTSLRMARLAAVIGDFVNTPAVIDSGCWEMQIALDPALLPATRLRLSLSSWRLSLRFESNDRDARCVILDNSRELQHRLQALLPAHIDIDIVCW